MKERVKDNRREGVEERGRGERKTEREGEKMRMGVKETFKREKIL